MSDGGRAAVQLKPVLLQSHLPVPGLSRENRLLASMSALPEELSLGPRCPTHRATPESSTRGQLCVTLGACNSPAPPVHTASGRPAHRHPHAWKCPDAPESPRVAAVGLVPTRGKFPEEKPITKNEHSHRPTSGVYPK